MKAEYLLPGVTFAPEVSRSSSPSAPPGAPQAAVNGADADLCCANDHLPKLAACVRREAPQKLLNVHAPRSLASLQGGGRGVVMNGLLDVLSFVIGAL